jgi:hypothetical protein
VLIVMCSRCSNFEVSVDLLTGDATEFVARFGGIWFDYNCFTPPVSPVNPHC